MEKKIRHYRNNRLEYYFKNPNSRYWDSFWASSISPKYYAKYIDGDLGEYSYAFEKYLKKDELILEAGCGNARYVIALRKKGYDVEGIDWGEETVASVLKLFPDLPIKLGNVTNIQVPDNYYDGYISLGVVEHRREGPEPFLTEAYRVLKPGGIGLIAVPYFNLLRRVKGLMGFYRLNKIEHLEFYQYAFSKSEFFKLLQQTSFIVIKTHGLAGYYGLKEELLPFFDFLDKLPGGWRIKKHIKSFKWLHFIGHVMIFVVVKPEYNITVL